MNLKNLVITINYITNFRPNNFNKQSNIKLKFDYLVTSNSILCKNLFIFLLFLKFCFKKKFFKNISFFIKPHYKTIYTILRAPYRYKLGKYQLELSRFFFICRFEFYIKKEIELTNKVKPLVLLKLCQSFCNTFETNICYINSLRISLPF